ncbi:tetratricopeptide repeat protein [bacterium]|nr:tetratricopeptide repeat protein [bacterium]
MNLNNLLVPALILFLIQFGESDISAQELKPHNVIISSSYYEKSQLKPFLTHSYSLLETSYSKEPYLPSFKVEPIETVEDYSHNIKISGLTKSFGRLSELFLGKEGTLENAFLLFLKEEYVEAESKLLTLLPSVDEVGERGTLLLAWTKYRKQQYESALIYAKGGFNSKNLTITQESYYIYSLVLLKQHRYEELALLYLPYIEPSKHEFWNSRLCIIYLYNLTILEKWNDARKFLWRFNIKQFAHSKNYYKLHEIEGIIYFKLKQYPESLESLTTAKQLNPQFEYQKHINRIIAWINYFLGKYKETVNQIEQKHNLMEIKAKDEIQYLKIASLTHLGDFQAVKREFDLLSPESPFYKLAAFIIQTFSMNQNIGDEFKKLLLGIHYDFPEMKFHTALLNGINAFRNNLFEAAEAQFFKAISIDVNNTEYNVALYNLGLTHLRLNQFGKAAKDFGELLQLMPTENTDALHYHILYCLYQLGEKSEFLTYLNQIDLQTFSDSHRWEIMHMHGNILLTVDSNAEAATLFFTLWDQSKDVTALESAVTALYKDRKFEEINSLKLGEQPYLTEPLFIFEIKSLLGSKRNEQASQKIERATYTSESFIQLQLEVWMADFQYERIVSYVSQLLNQSLSQETRLLYYLSLGDAHFNLKNYGESKNQFFKALSLTDDPLRKSLIQYNIVLITYYKKDYPSFLKETNVILANKDLTPEIRYNLTQLLVDYYQQNEQTDLVDKTLETYAKNFDFQKVKAKLKRLQLLYQNGFYEKCFWLANEQDPMEDSYQTRDRIILLGYCGNYEKKANQVIDILSDNLKKNPADYRADEMNLVLAEAYFLKGDYKSSLWLSRKLTRVKLNREITFRNQLLLVDSLVHLGSYTQAEQELGNTGQYRQTKYFSRALKLNAEIQATKKNVDESVRSLLRVYYEPNATPRIKNESLIRISEIYLATNRTNEAKSYFSKIDSEYALSHEELQTRFAALGKKLNSRNAP